MSDRQRAVNLSEASFRKLNAGHRRQQARLPPLPLRLRRRPDDFDLIPMVVTNVGSAADPGGIGENVAVRNTYTAGKAGTAGNTGELPILAVPLQEPPGVPFQDLDGDVVNVTTRMLTGPIFTGQVFLMAPVIAYNSFRTGSAGDVVGEYVSGGAGYLWNGVMNSPEFGYVDLTYLHHFGNKTATRGTCRVVAANLTGIELQKNQSVLVQWMQDQFAITEYRCLL